MPVDPEKERLPFEPNRKRKKNQTDKAKSSATDRSQSSTEDEPVKLSDKGSQKQSKRRYTREETSIPETVSRRMLRRMLLFSGMPVVVGILIFFGSYVIIIQDIAELPNVVVLLTTLACFGLSVVGLSYGALSASWDEDAVGSIFGLEQFQMNFGRLIGSWRQAREERRNQS